MLCIYDLLFRYFAEKHCNHNRLWATRLRHRGTATGVVFEGAITPQQEARPGNAETRTKSAKSHTPLPSICVCQRIQLGSQK